jgi:hypothetical protein
METTNLIRAMLAGLVIVSGLLLSSCGGGGDTASGGGVDFASSLAVSSTRSKNNVGTEFNASYVALKSVQGTLQPELRSRLYCQILMATSSEVSSAGVMAMKIPSSVKG